MRKIQLISAVTLTVLWLVVGVLQAAIKADNKHLKSATEIFTQYAGSDSFLSKQEMQRYLADLAFNGIDENKDKVISYVEYLNAYLYCEKTIDDSGSRIWACNNKISPNKNEIIDILSNLTFRETKKAENLKSINVDYKDQDFRCIYKIDDAGKPKWECEGEVVRKSVFNRFKEDRDKTDNKILTSMGLPVTNHFWKEKLSLSFKQYWQRATKGDCKEQLSLECFASFLQSEEEFELPKSADNRLELLRKYVDEDNIINADVYDAFRRYEVFQSIDEDRSNCIDIIEITKEYGSQVVDEFLRITNGNALEMTECQFVGRVPGRPDCNPEAILYDSLLGELIKDGLLEGWEDIADINNPYIADGLDVEGDFEAQEKARKQKSKKLKGEKILGASWIKGLGLILDGERVYDEKTENETLNWKMPALTMRFVKEFENAGGKAEPGSFSYIKDDGTEEVLGLEFALRFDLYTPSWYNLTDKVLKPSFGYQINNTGTDDSKKDEHRLYFLFDLSMYHSWDFLRANYLQIGPYVEFDNENDDDKITGLIDWEPQLSFLGFNTGIYYPLFKSDNFEFYLRPLFALEIDSYFNTSQNSDAEDNTYLRYGYLTGLRFYKQIEVTHKLRQRNVVDKWEDGFLYHETSIRWAPNQNEWMYFEFGYKKGKEKLHDDSLEQYSGGIGLKF